jgi:hypothetical protein
MNHGVNEVSGVPAAVRGLAERFLRDAACGVP